MIKLITDRKEHTFGRSYTYITIGRNVDKIICEEGMSYFKAGDVSASRVHCEIENQEACYVVRDMGSSNGTFVNGLRVTDDRILDDGDIITIGRTNIAVEIGGEVK